MIAPAADGICRDNRLHGRLFACHGPAVLLAQDTDYADLDGPLLLARDRPDRLRYEGSLVYPPDATLWG